MSANAIAGPSFRRRGLSDRDCAYFVPPTHVGDLSRKDALSSPPVSNELIEADAALICSTWFLPTARSMLRLARLPAGWDSRGAPRIERTVVENALLLLAGILEVQTAPPAIVPTVSGGVQAEWHMGGLNVEIEFNPSAEALVSVDDLQGRSEWEGALRSNIERLQSYLPRLESA